MGTKAVELIEPSDADLVAQSLVGRRDAFGQIVQRYQSLVCTMAYSATGSIAQSEDVGQEVFLSAWKQLRQLREPARLKPWLCGITRNILKNDFRRRHREPTHDAGSLEELPETAAREPLPSDRTISREEEGILWQSLERIPEVYREPLILFYREHQSIGRVAAALDLSEEAVKQRLSRGRRLLQQQVWSFVEGALERTAPDQTFTHNVLSALPNLAIVAGSGAAGGSAAIQAGATGKVAASAGGMAAFFGPMAGLFGAAIGTKLAIASTTSQREKRFVRKAWLAMWLGAALYCVAAGFGVHLAEAFRQAHPLRFAGGLIGSVFCYGAAQGAFCLWMARVQSRIRNEDMREPSHLLHGRTSYEYRSRRTLLGLPLLHIRFGFDEKETALPAKGWIAVGQVAHGIVFAAGARAIGLVSVGAMAIGVFAWGGCGIGMLAFGGVSLGVAATGGGAIGYVAYGGGAVGWQGAAGGSAIARHFAQGGAAFAEHANDRAAQNFMHTNEFFRHAAGFTGTMILLSWLLMAVPAYYIWRLKRRRRDMIPRFAPEAQKLG
jgi:RNA polymerase sigma factor (sigma-70 family)